MITGNSNLLSSKIKTNPNLLRNWYFVGGGSQQGDGIFPINQRGQTSYTGTGYTIDRWKNANNRAITTISSDGLSVVSDNGRNWANVEQYFENPARLLGKRITLSMLTTGNELMSETGTIPSSFPASTTTIVSRFPTSCAGLTFRIDTSKIFLRITTDKTSFTEKIVAIKLELGSTQTLAHQNNGIWVLNEIPDFDNELWQCQRYFQVFKTQSLRPTYKEDFRPTMFKDPTLSTLTLDGTTYYTAEADGSN